MDTIIEDACGHYVESLAGSEKVFAFVPAPLPVDLDYRRLAKRLAETERLIGHANAALAGHDLHRTLPRGMIEAEAVHSSRIEGFKTTIDQYFSFKHGADIAIDEDDLGAIDDCIDAMTWGFDALSYLPLSLRFMRNTHEMLMKGPHGHGKMPGEFRRSQNWIGGTKPSDADFVPAPVTELGQCLDAIEKFIHADDDLPDLIRAGMIHAQFETLHPFLDGNGRVGRAMIHFYLKYKGVVGDLVLPISRPLADDRESYYASLAKTRFNAGWTDYMVFFLDAVKAAAEESIEDIESL